jgi:ABC-2 type transport system permease protein/sodium transport system permease protein
MSLANRLWVKSGLTTVLFLMMPIAYAWWQGLDLARTFRFIGDTRWLALLPGLVLIACGAWTMAHEIFVFSEWLGIASLRTEQIDAAKETKIALQRLPLWLIWLTMAIVPAVSEEVFFRGFALRSLQATAKPGIAILLSATLFGLFHVFAGSILAIERFLPTAALGCLLAWLAWRTHSLLPGIMVHAGHNGLLFTMAYYEESLHRAGWGVQDQRHLPILWILLGIAATLIGIGYVHWLSKSRNGS